MNKIETVKTVGQIVISVGVGAIVGNVIKSTTPSQIGLIKKVCIGIGSMVLSNMICDKASEYSNEKIDCIVNEFTKVTNAEAGV